MSASAALSTGLNSNYGNKPTACKGRSPGYWKNHGGWPVPSNTPFSSVFSCSFKNDSTYESATLLQHFGATPGFCEGLLVRTVQLQLARPLF